MTRVVIDIPVQIMGHIMTQEVKLGEFDAICEAIDNGEIIPEGCGDLIDRKALKEVLKENEWITNTDGGGLEDIIDNAPTVIEGAKINTSVEDS